jgi:hypothetical protein
MRGDRLIAAVIVVVAVLLIGAIFGLGYSLAGVASEIGLPVLAIAGVVLLLATLALVSVAFSVFGLDDKTQALALPEGSIRAVIALSLIVMFAVLSVYLYGSLANGRVGSVSGLDPQQKESFVGALGKDQLVAVVPTTGAGPFTVYFHDRSAASDDFAKQLLVLIGTLVTSVASFYFGARAVESRLPASAAPRAPPAIRGVAPASLARGAGPLDLEIAGDRLDLVKEVKLVSGASQVMATDVVSSASTIRCRLVLDPGVPTGPWDVVVTDGIGRTATLPQALTVT